MGTGLGAVALKWLLTAVVTMVAVGMVAPGNKDNTLLRALGVSAAVAILITPIMWFWFLLIPAIVGVFAWFVVYRMAYSVRTGQAFAIGIVQAALGFVIDFFFLRGRLG